MKNLPKALVLSLSATGVAVARALTKHDVKIYGVDHQFAAGVFSKFIHKPFFGYKVNLDDEFLENLIKFSRMQDLKPVLFPSDDKFIEFVGINYDVLKNYYIIQKSLHPDVSKLFLDKRNFYELCEKYDVSYPKTIYLSGNESVEYIVDQIRFPLILKPYLIHKLKSKLHGKKVIFVKDVKELEGVFVNWRKYLRYMLIQEVLEGEESDIWIFKGYFDENGKLLDSFTGRKLRQYPPVFGSACLATSAANDTIAQISIELLTRLRFQGLCGTEFKFDRRDNQYKMIEINIRPQIWDDLMRISGRNLTLTAYRDMIGHKIPTASAQIQNARWGYLTRDFLSAIWHMKQGNLRFSDWLRSYKGISTDALLDKNDKKCLLGVPAYTLYQFYRFYISSKE
jgi:predicted ATP-grasp superfamily ATP-dependent carboligase